MRVSEKNGTTVNAFVVVFRHLASQAFPSENGISLNVFSGAFFQFSTVFFSGWFLILALCHQVWFHFNIRNSIFSISFYKITQNSLNWAIFHFCLQFNWNKAPILLKSRRAQYICNLYAINQHNAGSSWWFEEGWRNGESQYFPIRHVKESCFLKKAEFFPAGIRTRKIFTKRWGKQFFLNSSLKFDLSLTFLDFGRNTENCFLNGFLMKFHFYLQQQEQLMYGEEGTCTLCSKTFARKSSLLTHIRNHTAERKYQCPTCQKSKRLKMSSWIQRMRKN